MFDYLYPPWTTVLGYCIGVSSFICVPSYMVYHLLNAKGTFKQVWSYRAAFPHSPPLTLSHLIPSPFLPNCYSSIHRDCVWSFLFRALPGSALSCEHTTGDQDQRSSGQRLARKSATRIGVKTQTHACILQRMCRLSRCCN